MRLLYVNTPAELIAFHRVEADIYADDPVHRSLSPVIVDALVTGRSIFCSHASVVPYLIECNRVIAGRFALIHDRLLPDVAQVAFFEALPGIPDLSQSILREVRRLFPFCKKIVFGLNGHLNYGAGFLLNRHDEVPLYDLPHTKAYYPDYFCGCNEKRAVTYRYPMEPLYRWCDANEDRVTELGIRVRPSDMAHRLRELALYTELNNLCFSDHPYWAHRIPEEDTELFDSIGSEFRCEYLLFAEKDGESVGFLLWFPDYNETPANRYTSYRLYEIGVKPGLREPVSLALIQTMVRYVQSLGCSFGEGGFIFQENRSSINMTTRYLQRIYGHAFRPYRMYAVYEAIL